MLNLKDCLDLKVRETLNLSVLVVLYVMVVACIDIVHRDSKKWPTTVRIEPWKGG